MKLFVVMIIGYHFARAATVFMQETGNEKRIWLSDEARLQPVTDPGRACLYPDIDATGHKIAYVCGNHESTGVYLLDRTTSQEQTISEPSGLQLHPDFSGDGRFLAFASPVDGISQIVVEDLCLKKRVIVRDPFASYFPALSSDGSFVVYQRTRGPKEKELVFAPVGGDSRRVLKTGFTVSMSPALSWDDRMVAFTAIKDGKWDIFTFDRTTAKVGRITKAPGRNFAPTFAEDFIVYASDRTGRFRLYKVDLKNEQESEELVPSLEGDLYAPALSSERPLESSALPSIPNPPRSSFGAVEAGGRIYVIGGHQGPEHTYPEESFLGRVDIFDIKTQTWRRGRDRETRSHGFGLAANGRYIYAFGGFAFATPDQVFKPKWRSLDVIERYDTQTDEWVTLGRMPRRRSSYVVATVGEKAYLIGGWDSTPKFEGDYDGVFHRKIDVFDFTTETISEAPFELPDPLRRALTSVVHQGRIYLVGGLGQGATHFELLDNVTGLDPKTGTWSEMPALPFATFAPAVGVLNDTLLVFGGMFKLSPKEYVYVNHVFESSIREPSWRHTGRYLGEPKGFSQVVASGNDLIVLGGHAYFGGVDAPVASVDRWGFSSFAPDRPPSSRQKASVMERERLSSPEVRSFPARPSSLPVPGAHENPPGPHLR